MNAAQTRYGGFWRRFAALLLDGIVLFPLLALDFWGTSRFRLFHVYYLLPNLVVGLFYSVYLVRRYGGTPGKLIMGLRVRRVSGERVRYREAFLRYAPDCLLGVLMSIGLMLPVLQMTDAEYHALSFTERSKRLFELAPVWLTPVRVFQPIWTWGELIVLLTNAKKRALHDFIAGTVVVRDEA
jgi:uncharacterized RDD family membrane protein YckC